MLPRQLDHVLAVCALQAFTRCILRRVAEGRTNLNAIDHGAKIASHPWKPSHPESRTWGGRLRRLASRGAAQAADRLGELVELLGENRLDDLEIDAEVLVRDQIP